MNPAATDKELSDLLDFTAVIIKTFILLSNIETFNLFNLLLDVFTTSQQHCYKPFEHCRSYSQHHFNTIRLFDVVVVVV